MARVGFVGECLNREAIVPGRLKDVDSAPFHARSSFPRECAWLFFLGRTFLAEPARSSEKQEGFVEAALEHLSFQIDKRISTSEKNPFIFRRKGRLEVEENGSPIGIQNHPGLVVIGSSGRTAMAPSILWTAELTFQPHPRSGDYAAWINLSGVRRPSFNCHCAVFFQVASLLMLF